MTYASTSATTALPPSRSPMLVAFGAMEQPCSSFIGRSAPGSAAFAVQLLAVRHDASLYRAKRRADPVFATAIYKEALTSTKPPRPMLTTAA